MEQRLHHSSHTAPDGLLASVAMRQRGKSRVQRASAAAETQHSMSSGHSFLVAARDVHSPLQFIADSAIIVALAIGAGIGFQFAFHSRLGNIPDCAYSGLTVALIFAGVSRLIAGDNFAALTNTFDRVRDTAQSWTIAFAALAFALFTLKAGAAVSRGAIFTFYLVGLPVVAAWRVFTPVALASLSRRAGTAKRECIVIGDTADPLIEDFSRQLRASGHPAPTVIRFRAACLPSFWPQELQVLVGSVKEAARLLGPGEIFVCASGVAADRLNAIARGLSILPRAIFIVPDGLAASLARCKPTSIGTLIAVEIRREPMGRLQRAIKRSVDMLFAGAAALVMLPFFAAIALAIKLDSPGPAFFRQQRNGYQGKPFKILKFRSMHVQEDGPVIQQARVGDARVTRVGRFLRKSSIDELPQIFNILAGDMSLVGPRPHACAHDELYARSIENYEVRQHVKPGLTGWAQVHGLRGETATLEEMYRRIEYDIWYAVNASILLDLEIMVRTVIEVCRHRNAY
jgi:undecaprenyl-phosphate galactose phosphotransferase/putative colanic acid biosynthesis UDP-glucose lipid carrier transferase